MDHKDLNVRPVMLLERSIGGRLQNVGIGEDFLNRTMVVWEIIPTINKEDDET